MKIVITKGHKVGIHKVVIRDIYLFLRLGEKKSTIQYDSYTKDLRPRYDSELAVSEVFSLSREMYVLCSCFQLRPWF